MSLGMYAQINGHLVTGYGAEDNKAKDHVFSASNAHYLVGNFKGEFILGFNYVNNSRTSAFLIREDASGNCPWLKTCSASGYLSLNAVAVQANYLVIAGSFSDSLFIGNDTLKASGVKNAFIALYDTLGNYIKSYAPEAYSSDINDIEFLPNGQLLITGLYFNHLVLGVNTYASPLGSSMFLLHFDVNNWVPNWSQVSTGSATYGQSLSYASVGCIYVCGSYGPQTQFSGLIMPPVSGDHNLFVAKYLENGPLVWVQSVSSSTQVHGLAIRADAEGSVYFSGEYEMDATFPNQQTLSNLGLMDAFIAKMDSSGQVQWIKRVASDLMDKGVSIEMDALGHPIFLVNGGNLQLDGVTHTSNGFQEPFVVKLDRLNGGEIWHHRLTALTNSGIVLSTSMAMKDRKICIAGSNRTGILFQGDTIDSPNLDDVFWYTFTDTSSFSQTAGLEEITLEQEMLIYPNPFSSSFCIQTKQPFSDISVYDLNGKLLYSTRNLNTSFFQLNDIHILPGTYLVQVNYVEHKTEFKTLIKR